MKKKCNPFLRSAALATSIFLTLGQAASAANYYWDTTTGSWAAGDNWSDNATSGGTTGIVPLAADSVFFNQSSVNGAENISLNGNQSITGITFNNTGTTAITSGTGANTLTLGTGGITIASSAGAVTLNTGIKLDGIQAWTNNSTTNPFTVSSTITNVADTTPYTLTIDGAGATRLNGVISNGGATGTTALVKSGTGTLTIGTISGVANSFSGGTTINANSGTVIVTSTGLNGLGTGAISIGSGSTLQYNTSTRGTNNTISNAFSGSGTLKLYSSPMQVASGFSMGGSTFSGFTGTIQVTNNGVNGSEGSKLNIGSSAFNASGASLILDSGSQLYYIGGANTATFSSISVSGNGGNEGRGALRIESGTLAGNITLTGSSAWGQAGGTISGSITGTATTGNTQTLTLGTVSQSGAGTLSGVISDGAGGGKLALTKRNTGALNLTGTAVKTFTGGLNVNGGTLTIDYTAAGSPLTDLVNAGNAVSLGGGTLGVKGATSGTTSQSFTNGVNFASGTSGVTVNKNGGTSTTLNLGTITHSVGGVASFTSNTALAATVSTTEMIKVTNGASGANGALGAWALANGPTTANVRYVAVDSSGALKLVTANTTLGTNWSLVTDAAKVYTTNAAVSLTTNVTAQALQNPAAGNVLVQLNGQTLTTNGLLALVSGITWSFNRTDSGGITIGAENEFVMAGVGNIRISAPIANKSGNNSNLTYAGGGTLTLDTVASTYTGTTTVNSGTLTLGLANVLNSSSSLVNNGGTVGISTFDQSLAGVKVSGGAITGTTGILTSSSAYDIQSTNATGITAILAGNVGLNKTTDFNATLSGANTFTGDVNIKAGALTISTPSNPTPLGNTANMVYLGDSSGIDYATLNFGNSITVANPVTVQSGSTGAKTIKSDNVAGAFSGNMTLNDDLYLWTASGSGRLTLSGTSINLGSKALRYTNAGTSTAALTLSGTMTGATGSVEIVGNGSGTSIFSSTGSTYGGGTVLGGIGTVQIDASSTGSVTSGPFGTGRVTFNGAAVNAGITADQTIANAITIAENTTFANQTNEKNLTFSGATTLANGDRTLTVNLGTSVAGKGVTFSNAIGDNGQGFGLTKAGTGLLTLSGANTYGGATNLTAGKTQIGVGNVGSVGNITSSALGTGALTFNGGTLSSDSTTARTILNAVTFTGNATLGDATNNGKLTFNANTDLGTAVRTLTLSSDAQFDGIISGALGGINKSGAAILTLAGTNNSYSGITGISQGTLNVASLSDYGVASSIGARDSAAETASGDGIGLRIGTGTTGATLQYTGSTAQSTNRQIRISAANNTIDASGTGAGTLSFTYSGANTNLFDTSGARTLTLTGSNTGNNTFAIRLENQGANATSLTKSGAGTWVLTGANTFTGVTSIGGGTLVAAHVSALTTSSAVNISNTSGAGTLRLATDTSVDAYVIGGSSNNQGTIISDRATAGAGINHVLGAAALGNNTYNIQAGSNVTSGTAGISLASLNAAGGFAGTMTLNPTTANLTIVGAVNIGSSNNAKTLNLGGSSSGNAINGVISNGLNTLSLTKSNSSTWALSGTNTYTGNTKISAGTLALTGAGSISNSAVISLETSTSKFNVTGVTTSAVIGGSSSAQTLKGIGTVEIGAKILSIGANGTLAPGNSPGTLTFDIATGGTLNFTSGSDVSFELGSVGLGSDLISFSSTGNWLTGSGNATLALTLLSGFDYANTYNIFENVSTTGFDFAGVTGYDTANYTHSFVQNGSNYQLSFAPVPESSTALLGLIGSALFFRRRRN
jgi:fibronectin-binding autotransporter adhesin